MRDIHLAIYELSILRNTFVLNYHTNLVESKHFDFAPDLPDFRGGAFPRVVRFLVETSNTTLFYLEEGNEGGKHLHPMNDAFPEK